jgi:hypothetical protein
MAWDAPWDLGPVTRELYLLIFEAIGIPLSVVGYLLLG